jgi:molybdenum cofactor cytidylyltransferase
MDPQQRVAAVVLAAGRSTRFGSPKQLARIGDRTILEAVIAAAGAAELDPIVVVVPPGLSVPAAVRAVSNDRPQDGVSRSLRLGIGAVPSDRDAAVILLGDQPTIAAAHLKRLVAARGERPIIATIDASGVIAPPVLLERRAFDLTAEATGDEGLGPLIRRNQRDVATVEVAVHARDVDTPADLAAPGI